MNDQLLQCIPLRTGGEVQCHKKDWIVECFYQYTKKKLMKENIKNVAHVFCEANEERRRTIGIFSDGDFLKLNAWSVGIFKKITCYC